MNWLKRLFSRRPSPEPLPANVIKHAPWIEARLERVERTLADAEIQLIKERRRHDSD